MGNLHGQNDCYLMTSCCALRFGNVCSVIYMYIYQESPSWKILTNGLGHSILSFNKLAHLGNLQRRGRWVVSNAWRERGHYTNCQRDGWCAVSYHGPAVAEKRENGRGSPGPQTQIFPVRYRGKEKPSFTRLISGDYFLHANSVAHHKACQQKMSDFGDMP